MTDTNTAAPGTANASIGQVQSLGDAVPYADRDIIDEQLKFVLIIIIYHVLQIPTLVFGIATNLLNIVIFSLTGLNNGISIAFVALSISDLGYAVAFLITRLCSLMSNIIPVPSEVHLTFLAYYTSYYGVMFQDVSVIITVFIAVQKCACVAIPHLFKNVFSPRRTVVILVFLSVSMATTYVPILASMTFVRAPYPPMSNVTRIIIARSQLFFDSDKFWAAFNKLVLPLFSECICVVCLLVMVMQLKRSAEFRSSSTFNQDSADISTATVPVEGQKQKKKTNKDDAAGGALGQKERRAVTAVALVVVIYVICTLPATILNLAQLMAPSYFNNPRYKTVVRLMDNSQNILIHVGASINIFIYLNYNTKFRLKALVLLHSCVGSAKDLS